MIIRYYIIRDIFLYLERNKTLKLFLIMKILWLELIIGLGYLKTFQNVVLLKKDYKYSLGEFF